MPPLSSAASPPPAPSPSSASSSAALLPSLLSPSSPPPPSPNFTVILRERRGALMRLVRPGAAAKFSRPPPSQHGRRCLFQVLLRPARRRPAKPAARTPNPGPDPRPDPVAQDTAAPEWRAAARWPRPDGPARAAPQPGGVGRGPGQGLGFQVRVPGSRCPRVAIRSYIPGGAAAHGLCREQPARRPRSPRCLGQPGLGARAPRPHPSPPLKTHGAQGPRTCPAR